jgi:hypothetical protein
MRASLFIHLPYPATQTLTRGVLVRREIREKYTHPKLQERRLVYYVGTNFEDMTNTALCLGAYLMLEHGYSPLEAMKPFLRIRGCPLQGFCDATWAEPDFTLDAISCLEGLRKAVDQALLTDSPRDFVDEFDCDSYDELQDPEIMNVNQVKKKCRLTFFEMSAGLTF